MGKLANIEFLATIMFESEWKWVPENLSCFLDDGHLFLEAMILEATAMTLKDWPQAEPEPIKNIYQWRSLCKQLFASSNLAANQGSFSGLSSSSQKLSSCSSGALGPDGAADLDSLAWVFEGLKISCSSWWRGVLRWHFGWHSQPGSLPFFPREARSDLA